jgi:hypothetical protein
VDEWYLQNLKQSQGEWLYHLQFLPMNGGYWQQLDGFRLLYPLTVHIKGTNRSRRWGGSSDGVAL